MSVIPWDRTVQVLRHAVPKPDRWVHIWGVVETALSLAERHDLDLTQTAWAALLHDSAKCLDKATLEQMMRDHDLAEHPDDWQHPAVWHALVGAYLARTEHGVEDESILRAIRYHPTGAPDMDRLGLILFVADYTEPSRDYPGARELRRLALEAPLEDTAARVCRNKIEYVQGKGRTVHSRSLRALESLERRSKELRTTRPL